MAKCSRFFSRRIDVAICCFCSFFVFGQFRPEPSRNRPIEAVMASWPQMEPNGLKNPIGSGLGSPEPEARRRRRQAQQSLTVQYRTVLIFPLATREEKERKKKKGMPVPLLIAGRVHDSLPRFRFSALCRVRRRRRQVDGVLSSSFFSVLPQVLHQREDRRGQVP
jgi:hypothetical protein